MLAAFVATVLFSVSVIAAGRSARMLGCHEANFWRVVVAVFLLGAWAYSVGNGLGGGALSLFFLSGCVGFGLGDMALFQALPRLGPRLSSLMINCLAAPFAAVMEWVWLDTRLSWAQIACALAILAGVALALGPERNAPIPRSLFLPGILFGTAAGLGQALGAVLSRKAYAAVAIAGGQIDGGTAAYQRILGGLVIVAIPFLWRRVRRRDQTSPPDRGVGHSRSSGREAAAWVLLNGLTGPALGVGFYQWALKTTPSGLVLPILATTPLAVIPFSYWLEGDRPGPRSLMGGLLAVLGVVGLTLCP